jgi:hypothetical protein
VAPRQRLRAGAVTVDHGLQAGSAERARAVAATFLTSRSRTKLQPSNLLSKTTKEGCILA